MPPEGAGWRRAALRRRFPGQAPRLGEVAAAFGRSRQNTKQVARQLQARGYLELRPDPADARAVRLQVTRKVARFDRPRAVADQLRFLERLLAPLDRLNRPGIPRDPVT